MRVGQGGRHQPVTETVDQNLAPDKGQDKARVLPDVSGYLLAAEHPREMTVEQYDEICKRRIQMQGVAVIPLSLPPDLAGRVAEKYHHHSRVSKVGKREQGDQDTNQGKSNKRKTSVIRILDRYWDNRTPVGCFGPEAQWLHHRLQDKNKETKISLSPDLASQCRSSEGGVKRLGREGGISSSAFWAMTVKTWLGSKAEQRKAWIEQLLTVQKLPDDDLRDGLRGQNAVFAATNIRKLTVLAPYAGKYCFGHDVAEERSLYGVNVSRYAVDCALSNVAIELCGYGYGNATLCINACRTYRAGEVVRDSNAEFVMVIYQGWPYIFLVSTKNISAGDEVLVDYGRYYWLGY